MQFILALTTLLASTVTAQQQTTCGSQIYTPGEFTCFRTPSGGQYACAIVNGNALQLCGENLCYDASKYRCTNGVLTAATGTASLVSVTSAATVAPSSGALAGASTVNPSSQASVQAVRASASASVAASSAGASSSRVSSAAAASSSARTNTAAGKSIHGPALLATIGAGALAFAAALVC
ncbi:hypothetical protein PYCC9005_003922 [Savitreella phatthalungensis]